MQPDRRTLRVLERLWAARYAAPDDIPMGLPLVAQCPRRLVLEAFLAWRELDLDQALALAVEALGSGELDPVWRLRARGVQAVVLNEAGLVEEAARLGLEDVETARRLGLTTLLATAVHDLAVVCQVGDPERSAELLVEAIQVARRSRPDATPEDVRESCAIEALAVVNLRDLRDSTGIDVDLDVPGLAGAEGLALRGWPELASHVRAVRVLERLDADDLAGAKELALALPRPESMRDITNACTVARAQARIEAAEGDPAHGAALVAAFVERLPDRHRLELLGDLVALRRQAGDLEGALDAALELADCRQRVHLAGSRTAVRTLDVWHRSER